MNPREIVSDRYLLERPLGKGGHAEVWCGHDQRLDRPVAIKLLDPRYADDPEFLVRFFSEAQTVARISHPNVVPILDFGDHDGRPFIVMEYLTGGSLEDVVGEPMLPARALDLVANVARGAGAAHAMGLIHRDIKPANVLLSSDGIPKLGDFGISVSKVQEKLTATGTAIGSPHYVSPEHASGAETTPASDVYSLGVVLYELLTGRRPFEKENATALAIAHVEEAPEPPSALVGDLDPEIDGLVLRAMAKDPSHRFEDGHAFAAALDDPARTGAWIPPVATSYDDEAVYETPVERNTKRVLVGSLLALGFVALLGFGVFALGSKDEPETARASSGGGNGVTTSRVESPRNTPTPTPTGSDDYEEGSDYVAAEPASTPSPTPSDTPAEEETPTEEPTSEPTMDPAGEPTTEPTPEPTSEPTTDPSPAPTSTP